MSVTRRCGTSCGLAMPRSRTTESSARTSPRFCFVSAVTIRARKPGGGRTSTGSPASSLSIASSASLSRKCCWLYDRSGNGSGGWNRPCARRWRTGLWHQSSRQCRRCVASTWSGRSRSWPTWRSVALREPPSVDGLSWPYPVREIDRGERQTRWYHQGRQHARTTAAHRGCVELPIPATRQQGHAGQDRGRATDGPRDCLEGADAALWPLPDTDAEGQATDDRGDCDRPRAVSLHLGNQP